MSLTIRSARWANQERTRAVVVSDERGAVLVRNDKPAAWAALSAWVYAGGTVAAFEAPAPRTTSVDVDKLAAALERKGVIVKDDIR